MNIGQSVMPIVVVAHSMGGLVVREAFNLLDLGNSDLPQIVFISLATPFGGHPVEIGSVYNRHDQIICITTAVISRPWRSVIESRSVPSRRNSSRCCVARPRPSSILPKPDGSTFKTIRISAGDGLVDLRTLRL